MRGEEDPAVKVTILLHVFYILSSLDGPHFLLFKEHIDRLLKGVVRTILGNDEQMLSVDVVLSLLESVNRMVLLL